jgi:hypothetical protein
MAARGAFASGEEFRAEWQELIMRLAMAMHQRTNGAAGPERIAQARGMGS